MTQNIDKELIEIFLEPIRKSKNYKPAFGQGGSGGVTLSDFEKLYGNDMFYSWIGLDDALVYTAHKAVGGLTSVYRQIGIGTERLFQAILAHSLGIPKENLNWSYTYSKPNGTSGVHTLDSCIRKEFLDEKQIKILSDYFDGAVGKLASKKIDPNNLTGIVFEVRQGYKSADSKRQNADLRYGMRAYQELLLPAVFVMSSQISAPVVNRYRNDGMLILTGVNVNDPYISGFSFFKDIIGFDLAAFFERNTVELKNEIHQVVSYLLTP